MNPAEPRWVSQAQALHIHAQSIKKYGGIDGVRDMGLLESALARAENLFAYGQADIFQFAASYAIGIARNHAFVDGNKRTAYGVAGLFLYTNGYKLTVADADAHITFFESVAAGHVTQDALAAFYSRNTIPINE